MSAIEIAVGTDAGSSSGGADVISQRLQALPASSLIWKLVILLSLGGCLRSTTCSSPAISRRA